MQPVLERGSIDKPLTFDVGLIQLSFIPVCSPIIIHATFQLNCAEGLLFHCHGSCVLIYERGDVTSVCIIVCIIYIIIVCHVMSRDL